MDKQVYGFLKKPGEITELRILGVFGTSSVWSGYAKGTVTGLFDNHEGLCKAIISLQKIPYKGVYFTPQVIDPRLIGRAYNRLVAAEKTTSDNDVLAFRFLLVDVDPQANLTSWLLGPASEELEETVGEILLGKADIPGVLTSVEAAGLSLIPSGIHLSGVERILTLCACRIRCSSSCWASAWAFFSSAPIRAWAWDADSL